MNARPGSAELKAAARVFVIGVYAVRVFVRLCVAHNRAVERRLISLADAQSRMRGRSSRR